MGTKINSASGSLSLRDVTQTRNPAWRASTVSAVATPPPLLAQARCCPAEAPTDSASGRRSATRWAGRPPPRTTAPAACRPGWPPAPARGRPEPGVPLGQQRPFRIVGTVRADEIRVVDHCMDDHLAPLVMPDASQPKIIGSRSAGNPTPRSDHTSWFSAAAFTVTSTQPRRRGQFDLAHPESLQRIRGIQAGGIRSDHALRQVHASDRVRAPPPTRSAQSSLESRMSAEDVDLVAQAFAEQHGRDAIGVWAAPGRVNLIGEHTDYNDGFVLPFALAQRVTIAAGPRSDSGWTVTSLTKGETKMFTSGDLVPGMSGWQAYVAGVVWAWRRPATRSAAPIWCSPLTSRSVLDCRPRQRLSVRLSPPWPTSTTCTSTRYSGPSWRARENEFVGAPTGLMDQAASTRTPGHALFFDCRTLDSRQVRMDLILLGWS